MPAFTLKKPPPMPLAHLVSPCTQTEEESFTRVEVAAIFGDAFHPSHISKIQDVLHNIEQYDRLSRLDIWKVYIYQCWRQFQMAKKGVRYAWKTRFVAEFQSLGGEAFLEKYVIAIEGSQKDCDRMIDEFLAKKFTNKLN